MVIIIKSIELNSRDNSLNLLRLLFASFVLIWHSYYLLGIELNLPYQLSYILRLAVPCFFVVSGYLITGSAIKHDLKTYFKKRFARIYPAYLFSIIATILIFAPITFTLNNGGHFNIIQYLSDSNIFLYFIKSLPFKSDVTTLGTTLINIHTNVWNGSAWTLQYEFGCYIAIALIFYVLTKLIKNKKNFPKIIFGLYIISLIISLIYLDPTGKNFASKIAITAVYFFSIFLGGSIVYLLKDYIKFSYKLLILSIIYCIIIMTFVPYFWAMELSAIPMIYIILFISIKLKSPKWIQKNDISYGVYIYAWPIQVIISYIYITYSIPKNIGIYMIICMMLVAGFSTLSWFLIEKPILTKVR